MAATPKDMDFKHPQFFISQSERLSALLTAVVAESSTATDPDACIDYLEITEILVDLLDQSQYFSVLSFDQIQEKWHEVQSLMGKVQTIQDAVADWDTRTKEKTEVEPPEAKTAGSDSRKRARSMESEAEFAEPSKRRRESGGEQIGDTAAGIGLEVVPNYISPSIERPPAPWWTEPFYD